jgi:multidrug efflux system membrane fusion protein
MRTRHVLLLLIILAPALAGACSSGGAAEKGPIPGAAAPGGGRGGEGRGGAANAPVPITAAAAVEKAVPLDIQAIGSGEAYSNVAIRAQVTGELTSVNFKEGDDVEKGQVLFTLDRRPLEAALQQAQANLARDQAQATNAASQAARYQDLVTRGIATKEQADTQRTTATALNATVAADKAAVENAQVQLQYATITAPISGRTGALMVHPGNLVRANDTAPLVVINEIAPIYVTFTIPEAQLPDLKRYMAAGSISVRVRPPSDAAEISGGRITFVDNAVDQATGTIKVKASFDNRDHQLWPGQFLNVTMTLKVDQHAIVVPTAAVQTGPQGTYVFIVKPDKTVDMRPVEVARTSGADSIIASGVAAGDQVVTDGHLRLVPGSRVTIKENSDTPQRGTDTVTD